MPAPRPTANELVGTARQPNDGSGNIGTTYDIISATGDTADAVLTVRIRGDDDDTEVTYSASLFDWPVDD